MNYGPAWKVVVSSSQTFVSTKKTQHAGLNSITENYLFHILAPILLWVHGHLIEVQESKNMFSILQEKGRNKKND